MIRPISLVQAGTFLAAELYASAEQAGAVFNSVGTDTRSIGLGDLFVALRGENFDGHDFSASAVAAGAGALVLERYCPELNVPQLVVADTTKALGQLGLMVRQMLMAPLVALTGSCGKTSVKEMLAQVLALKSAVHATRGNFNNHIGVPLTLLAMHSDVDPVVVEMGASGLGEISYLASIAQPNVALVNNVMAAHLSGFGSQAAVAFEKSRIYFGLKESGTAIINLDEPYAQGWLDELSVARPDLQVVTYSLMNKAADVCVTNIQLGTDGCYGFDLNVDKHAVTVRLGLAGRQNISNALAVTACAHALGLSLSDIREGLESVKPVAGRVEPKLGLHGSLIIDDSYNANPGSVRAAASLLADLQGEKVVWLVLGDLGELGKGQEQELDVLGRDIAELGVKNLLTVGVNSAAVELGFSRQGQGVVSHHVSEQSAAIEFIKRQLKEDVAVLVKGSRSSQMDLVVNAIAETATGSNE